MVVAPPRIVHRTAVVLEWDVGVMELGFKVLYLLSVLGKPVEWRHRRHYDSLPARGLITIQRGMDPSHPGRVREGIWA